jgi:putative membrane protein
MSEKQINRIIIGLSVIIPIAVALMFRVKIVGYDFTYLPPIYATINGITGGLLIVAVIAIKKGNRKMHQMLMKLCLVLSASFLVMYVTYHATSESTAYLEDGVSRYIYFFILITHIVLSILIVPLVLFTFSRAIIGKFEQHRIFAKITYPLWIYVAFSGVIVYLMISPYYS